jgi:hydroxyquinol 1,2-dioxygenase
MIGAPGYQQLVTHIFAAGDQYLDSDVVFGVKDSLIREFAPLPAGIAADGRTIDRPYCRLDYDFALKGQGGEAGDRPRAEAAGIAAN